MLARWMPGRSPSQIKVCIYYGDTGAPIIFIVTAYTIATQSGYSSKADARKTSKLVETANGMVMHTSAPIIITGDVYTIAAHASKVDARKTSKLKGMVMHTSTPIIITGDVYTIVTHASKVDAKKKIRKSSRIMKIDEDIIT